jgi:TRAP-type C4-dicarboxylate transport system permease small subunit
MMFAVIEIACTLFIAWYAWQWASPKVSPTRTALAKSSSS